MAMTTEAPDPRQFKTWEDAFQYPIPTVRKLEQQLRNNADENREKLRSLVGTSYRNLLDTAETIIDMEVRMTQVESQLARVGQRCNTRGVERVAGSVVKMDNEARSHDAERYTFASQLAVLRNAPTAMTRLMKRDGSYLLIAKVLVISRLLHKALGQGRHKPPIVDQLWERLLSVRRKLLRRIDHRLSSPNGETATLVESMAAYALATSSTPSDVLQHFHKVRMEKIVGELKRGDEGLAKHGVVALKLCIQTCLDTQTIFPRRLAESLAKLKAHPLIQDPDVRGLYELNLDVHDRWLGDEARSYTPWPRHDELQRPEAEKILHRWSKDAIAMFLKGVKNALGGEERLKEVADLRQELIETWILSGSRMAGVKSANVLDDLRDIMNDKLEGLVRSRTQGLQDVVSQVTSQLDAVPSSEALPTLSLWSTTTKSSDLSNGAHNFKNTVMNTYQGRDMPVIDITSVFDKWMDSVLEVKSIVKSMKEARWDDTFADDVDDESDDDDLGDSKQTLLSDDDPRLLEETTQEALSESLKNLGQSFSAVIDKSVNANNKKQSVAQAVFILRVVRDIGDRIPRLKLQDRATSLPSPFSAETLQNLYVNLAQHVVEPTSQAYKKYLAAALESKVTSLILWEGNPPLPSQPSPTSFRFMRELNKNMAAVGGDLWAPASVLVLKKQIAEHIGRVIGEYAKEVVAAPAPATKEKGEGEEGTATEEESEAETNGDSAPNASSKEIKEQKLTQLLFDALYIQRFVSTGDQNDGTAIVEAVEAEHLDQAAKTRLQKSAAEYAKKTYLLFALLA